MERGRTPDIRQGLVSRFAAGASVVTLALSMSGESSRNIANASPQPTPSSFEFPRGTSPSTQLAAGSLAATQCGLRYVYPNKYFNRNNGSLSRQAELIDGLYNTERTVKLGDIATAVQIIWQSKSDPRHAIATERSLNSAADGKRVNRSTFLDTRPPTPKPCSDRHHISRVASSAQLRRTARTGQNLTRRIGRRLGERAGRATRAAYERFKTEVDKLADQRP